MTSFLLDDFIKICYQQGRDHLYCCALVWMFDGFRCYTPCRVIVMEGKVIEGLKRRLKPRKMIYSHIT